MATRVNRAATAGQKKGGKNAKRKNITTQSYNTHESLESKRNQRVFRVHGEESEARRHRMVAGDPPERTQFKARIPGGRAPVVPRAGRVPRVSDPAVAAERRPKYRKKKAPSGRGISGGEVHIVADGDRPKPKRSGWSRG